MGNPQRLIDSSGEVRTGFFEDPIRDVNFADYDLRTPMGRPAGPWQRRFGFNQFQFLGALGEPLVLGCAIADIRLTATAFVYCYRPDEKRHEQASFLSPLSVGCKFDQDPEGGTTTFSHRGAAIEMNATAQEHERRLTVKFADGGEIDATFREDPAELEPMRICTRAGATGWVFARKTAAQRITGHVDWRGIRADLSELDILGHGDWSAGFMRRETFWNWACLAGRVADGRTLGLNLSCGVNETSYTENCFWLDGKLSKVTLTSFDYDRRDLMRPWTVGTGDGRVQLTFEPEGRHIERTNALIAATNFHQLFGRYSGTIRADDGEPLQVDNLLGYMESHYAKW